jgi:L-ascorbate metabolism protein UlaG (beta-lactamase superfamily)
MILTHYGREFFKIQSGETVLAYNPVSKESSLKQNRFGADIVLVAMNDADFNGVENTTYKDKTPFVISGPGEYEVAGIFIRGYLARAVHEGGERMVTIYSLRFDGIHMVLLGPLTNTDSVDAAIREKIGEIDVLFVPIAGGDILSPNEAYKLSVSLHPKVIIPMDWDHEKKRDSLNSFLKDAGDEVKPVDKYTFKKKDIDTAEGEIVVIDPTGGGS